MYLQKPARSELLVTLVRQYASPDSKILEIGCNVGRNLHHLYAAGFTNLAAFDISEAAIRLLQSTFPDTAARAQLEVSAIEDALPRYPSADFDLVFTMAVLEHVHDDSAAVFAEIARVVKQTLITIEDERHYAWHQFPRNYRTVFERLGLRQVEARNCRDVPALGADFFARVFCVR